MPCGPWWSESVCRLRGRLYCECRLPLREVRSPDQCIGESVRLTLPRCWARATTLLTQIAALVEIHRAQFSDTRASAAESGRCWLREPDDPQLDQGRHPVVPIDSIGIRSEGLHGVRRFQEFDPCTGVAIGGALGDTDSRRQVRADDSDQHVVRREDASASFSRRRDTGALQPGRFRPVIRARAR